MFLFIQSTDAFTLVHCTHINISWGSRYILAISLNKNTNPSINNNQSLCEYFFLANGWCLVHSNLERISQHFPAEQGLQKVWGTKGFRKIKEPKAMVFHHLSWDNSAGTGWKTCWKTLANWWLFSGRFNCVFFIEHDEHGVEWGTLLESSERRNGCLSSYVLFISEFISSCILLLYCLPSGSSGDLT